MGLFNRNGGNGKNGTGGGGLRERVGEIASRFVPPTIRDAVPWLQDARKSKEGRDKLTAKVKEGAYEWADFTTRAVTAGMGIADLRALFRGDPAIEKPNPRYKVHVNAFFAHLRPKYYDKASTRFTHTFGLGFLSVYMFVIETITGIILMIFYTPSDRRAYEDMVKIITEIPFGQLMRDIHRVGAELMVLVVTLHMARVFLTGSYKHPRTFTWLTGAVLFALTLVLSYSGYLLPWDQLAYWAVTIGSSMFKSSPPKEIVGVVLNLLIRGADTIGQNGLLRFYLLHIFVMPLLAIIFISVHYYRVARTHGISIPATEEESSDPAVRKSAKERIDYLPELFTKELLWTAIATFFVVVYSAYFFHAPLESHSDPFRTPLHTTAPWYFLWIQGMLKDAFLLPALRWTDQTIQALFSLKQSQFCLVCNYDSPAVQGIVLPTIVIGLLFLVPYINEWWEKLWRATPSRQLFKNRPLGLASAAIGGILLIVWWYQGTPFFGVVAPPSVEIGQEFMPEEGVLPPVPLIPEDYGSVRLLGWEGLVEGTYDLAKYESLSASPTPLERVLNQMNHAVALNRQKGVDSNGKAGLPNAKGVLEIASWAPNLKRVNLHIEWTPIGPGDSGTFDRTIYFNRYSDYR